jgi:anaerobic magnesium-protoporphyrin IX monomethyl ester cyclase
MTDHSDTLYQGNTDCRQGRFRSMTKLLFLIPMHVEFDSFVNPISNMRIVEKADGRTYNSLATDLPLGPLSMSAYIKKFEDVEVRLIDFNVELMLVDVFNHENFYDFCYDHLNAIDFEPDIIGVSSLFSPSYFNFTDCARAAKLIFPDALVIGGGSIPTNSYRYIYEEQKCESFDALCFGEGERPLLDLIRADDTAAFLAQSDSWITKEKLTGLNGSFTPKHDTIEDLDDIPFYDYDLCNMERHGVNQLMIGYKEVKHENPTGFHIMTSRGCPYMCTFCASHRVHGRKMRYHSVERVREDLTRLRDQYGARTVIFQDDHLMGDTDRVYKILDIVGNLELDSLFQNGLTLYALDRPMLEAFYNAGVRHLVLPVESGSEKVLKEQMKKPLKMHISERVAKDCRELGIYTNTNILIGLPGETKADIEETRRNLRNIEVNWFNIACTSPLVGSEIHEIALENGYISSDTMGSSYNKALIHTKDFTPEYIQDIRYLLNLELNFVYNNDMKFGEYELALRGFKNVIRFKPDHAFAWYYASQCYGKMGMTSEQKEALENYNEYKVQPLWQEYVEQFDLP